MSQIRHYCVLFVSVSMLFVSSGSAQRNTPPNFTPPPLPKELDVGHKFAPGLNPNEMMDELIMVDMPVAQVLKALEDLTGKTVLRSSTLPSPLLNFNGKGQLTRAETVLAIETILTLNGISVTSMGDKFLKAIPSSNIRFQSPDIITGSTLTQPPSQRHYSKIFQIKHLTLEEVTQIVNSLQTPGLSTQLALKKTNAIMVTDSLTNLQQIERILNDVDVPSKMDTEMIFRSLSYISAFDLKERLDSMLKGPLSRFLDGDTHVEADERTNQIILVTAPENVDVIEQVIGSLDVDAAPLTKTEVYYLKYANAEEVAPLLNSLVSGQTYVSKGSNSNVSATRRDSSKGKAGSGETKAVQNQIAIGDAESNDQFSPYITIESDDRSNAIIVFGTSSDLRYIGDLIGKVDVVLPQVKIDVVIAEVNIGDKYNRGIDSFGVNVVDAVKTTDEDGNVIDKDDVKIGINQLINADGTIGSSVADLPFRIFMGKTVEQFTLNTVFQTAESDSDVSILSAPTLVTTHNKEATIKAGEKRPVITGSSTDNTGTNTRSQIDLQDIGIELTFKPLIGSNGVVQLEIEQKIDNVKGKTIIDGNEQPILGSRSAVSYISVEDGNVIVLGGLQEIKTEHSEGRLFLLGQIPLLGDWLFSSKREEETVTDLVIFIRPQVIYNTDDSNRISDRILKQSASREEIENFLKSDKFKE